ncbi:MAG: hypothetical protein WDN44_03240 [Sphingomonas sp.]
MIAAMLKKGGAEGWAQVELDEVYSALPIISWVQREQSIYRNRKQAVDFLMMCSDGRQACIELKVESLFASAGQGRITMDHRYAQTVREDFFKLQNERIAYFADLDAYVVAIAFSDEAKKAMAAWLRGNALNFEHDDVLAYNGEWNISVYVVPVAGRADADLDSSRKRSRDAYEG